MTDCEIEGVETLSALIESVYWDIFPENEALLKVALYQTIQKNGGVDKFAEKCNISPDELNSKVEADSFEIEFYHKVFPYIILQLQQVFNQYIENEDKAELNQLFQKNGLDTREDFVQVVNETIRDFETSECRQKHEKIAQNLTELSDYFLEHFNNEKQN